MSRLSSALGGCLYRGTSLIVVLAAIGGILAIVLMSLPILNAVKLWNRELDTPEIRAGISRNPEAFVAAVKHAWESRINCSDAIMYFATACSRILLMILLMGTVGVIGAPNQPRRELKSRFHFLLSPAWRDVMLQILILAVFLAIGFGMEKAQPSLARKASAAVSAAKSLRGDQLHAALISATHGARDVIHTYLGLAAVGIVLFMVLGYRAVCRLFSRRNMPPDAAAEVFS
ncbi:MAG TPA: hypothetical protein VIC28_14320 [Thermoanaerobaculia bacterium]